jgi:hypothetical protein
MIYEVGDKVTLMTLEELKEKFDYEYESSSTGNGHYIIKTGFGRSFHILPSMLPFLGKEITILQFTNKNNFSANGDWQWPLDFIESQQTDFVIAIIRIKKEIGL